VIGLTKSIAAGLRQAGHPLQLHRPGTVDTPSLGDPSTPSPTRCRQERFIARQPMGGWSVEDITGYSYPGIRRIKFATGNMYFDRRGKTI